MPTAGTAKPLGYTSFAAESLVRMTRNLGLDGVKKDRSSLLAALGGVAGTPGHRAVLERELSELEWELLDLRLWELGPQRLDALHSYLSPENEVEGWTLLARLFEFACFADDAGPNGYGSFRIEAAALIGRPSWDLWHRAPNVADWAKARRTARTEAAGPPLATTAAPSAAAANGLGELQRAVYIILTEAARRPIRQKGDGRVYAADIIRLAQAFAGGAVKGKRTEAAEPPALVWFALGALIQAKLLDGGGEGLRPAPGAMDFLALPSAQQTKTLLNAWALSAYDDFNRLTNLVANYPSDNEAPWIERGGYRTVGYDALNRARVYLWRALRWALTEEAGAWYALDDFAQFAFSQYPDFLFSFHDNNSNYLPTSTGVRRRAYPIKRRQTATSPELVPLFRSTDWREVEGEFVREVFREAFWWLGLVELGPDRERPDSFRLSGIGRHLLFGTPMADEALSSPATLIAVQPNFEIVVPNAGADFGLLAEIDQFAERRTVDRAATFALTQAAFVRALDGRWTLESVVATLEGASGMPLPQNVRFSLDEWAAVHARLTLRTGATVISADSAAIDRWLADKTLGLLLGARLGSDAILVAAGKLDEVLKEMKMMEDRRYFLGKEPVELVDLSAPPEGMRVNPPTALRLGATSRNPYIEYRLGAMADVTARDDEATRYALTPESVARAVRHGLARDRTGAVPQGGGPQASPHRDESAHPRAGAAVFRRPGGQWSRLPSKAAT